MGLGIPRALLQILFGLVLLWMFSISLLAEASTEVLLLVNVEDVDVVQVPADLPDLTAKNTETFQVGVLYLVKKPLVS